MRALLPNKKEGETQELSNPQQVNSPKIQSKTTENSGKTSTADLN